MSGDAPRFDPRLDVGVPGWKDERGFGIRLADAMAQADDEDHARAILDEHLHFTGLVMFSLDKLTDEVREVIAAFTLIDAVTADE